MRIRGCEAPLLRQDQRFLFRSRWNCCVGDIIDSCRLSETHSYRRTFRIDGSLSQKVSSSVLRMVETLKSEISTIFLALLRSQH
jgi:hypothetical protein